MTEKIEIGTRKEWRSWLRKNHLKKDKIALVSYKKHTGKPSMTHKESMYEAICFGWIDTTIKKLDEEKYQRVFVKRKKGGTWSKNTISYAEELIKQKLMTKAGMEAYNLGKKKPIIDHGLGKNPKTPSILIKELKKEKLYEKFRTLAPSTRKLHIIMLTRAKRPETKQKRIKEIIELINQKP